MVLAVFLFLTSCRAFVDVGSPQDFAYLQGNKQVFVLSARTHFNERVYFSERFPGRMAGNEIVGIHQDPVFQLDADTLVYRNKRNPAPVYALKDGVRYDVVRQDNRNLLYNPYDLIHLPVWDFQQMHFKTSKAGNASILITGVSAGVVGVSIWVISSMSLNLTRPIIRLGISILIIDC